MAGPLSEDDGRQLHAGIARVLPMRDTSSQREELAVLARVYRHLDDEGRARFLRHAASDLGVDPDAARAAAARLLDDPADPHAQVALLRLPPPRESSRACAASSRSHRSRRCAAPSSACPRSCGPGSTTGRGSTPTTTPSCATPSCRPRRGT